MDCLITVNSARSSAELLYGFSSSPSIKYDLCLQAYFIEGEDKNPYNNSAEDRALLTLIRQSINAINPMIQNLKQHISQLQNYNNIPRYRIVLGEEAPEGQNPQLFRLPTLRELSAIIIDPDINIDIKSYWNPTVVTYRR